MQIADVMQGVNLSPFHPILLLLQKGVRVEVSRECSKSSSLGLQFLVNDMQPDSIAAPLHLRHQVPDLFDALHLLERYWHLHRRSKTGFGIWDLPRKSFTRAKFGPFGLNWDFFGTIFAPFWDF